MKVLAELQANQALTFDARKQLATKAFGHTADYDTMIHAYLDKSVSEAKTPFPNQFNLQLQKFADLRYGENPHQAASAYQLAANPTGIFVCEATSR